jgi:hypothetical protein
MATANGDDDPGLALPLLLADALRTHGMAIRRALVAAGFDDIPRAGAQVIGRIEHGGTTAGEVGMAFGAWMEASQLLDILVARGYVDRTGNAEEPRRMTVALGERGLAAAAVIHGAIDEVVAALVDEVGAEEVARARRVLAALARRSEVPAAAPDS